SHPTLDPGAAAQLHQISMRIRMQLPRCSVIIVGYNHASDLPACLEGVLSQLYPHVEIILVDNASEDATPGVAVLYRGHVRYPRLAESSGCAAGNNAGAAVAQGALLVFLNPDAVPQPGWLEALVQPLLNDETVGLTTSRILLHATP